jgi:heme exporter protein CcmD
VIEFLKMGGYAAYVWSAYGITLLVLGVSVWAARRRRLDALKRVRQALVDEPSRRQATVRKIE